MAILLPRVSTLVLRKLTLPRSHCDIEIVKRGWMQICRVDSFPQWNNIVKKIDKPSRSYVVIYESKKFE